MRSVAFAVILIAITVSATPGLPAAQEGGVVIIQRNPGGGVPVTGPASPANPNAPATPATGVILGRVVDADTSSPVAGATVSLGGGAQAALAAASALPQAPPQALTNGQGYFVFRDLAAASYTVSVQAGGYLPSSYGQRLPNGAGRSIELADGQRVVDATIRAWKPAVLTGRVLDEVGEPVIAVTVRSIRREANGRLVLGTTATTDDRGVYRIAGLVPGEYTVTVQSSVGTLPPAVVEQLRAPGPATFTDLMRDGISSALSGVGGGVTAGEFQLSTSMAQGTGGVALPVTYGNGRVTAYPTTYHPSATTVTAATFLRLASGAERAGVDIQMRPASMVRIDGIVMGPEGPSATFGLRLVPTTAASFSTDNGLETATTFSGPDGRFTFLGVPPGQYEIRALRIPRTTTPAPSTTISMEGGGVVMFGSAPPPAVAPSDPTLWASVPVDVGQRDVSGLVVTLAQGARVRGQLTFTGGQAPPRERMPQLSVSLIASSDRAQASPMPVGVDENLRFATAGYPGGRYLVQVNGVPPGWTVTEARAGDVNALVDPLTLDGRDINDVEVTIASGTTRVAGTVRAAGGRDPEAQVIAFPADFKSWIDAGMSGRRTRTVAARADGGFEMSGLIPGEYAFVAVPATSAIDPRAPSTIEALAKLATRATVAVGQTAGPVLSVATVR